MWCKMCKIASNTNRLRITLQFASKFRKLLELLNDLYGKRFWNHYVYGTNHWKSYAYAYTIMYQMSHAGTLGRLLFKIKRLQTHMFPIGTTHTHEQRCVRGFASQIRQLICVPTKSVFNRNESSTHTVRVCNRFCVRRKINNIICCILTNFKGIEPLK